MSFRSSFSPQSPFLHRTYPVLLILLLLSGGAANAAVPSPPGAESDLAARATGEQLGHRLAVPMRSTQIPDGPQADAWKRFEEAVGLSRESAERAFFDERTGRPEIVELSVPWIPGAGNDLVAGAQVEGHDTLATLEALGRSWIDSYSDLAGITSTELVLDEAASQGVGPFTDSQGTTRHRLWHLAFDWAPHGLPVEGARVIFRVNHGNLVHWEMKNITSALDVPRADIPALLVSSADTRKALHSYLGGDRKADLELQPGDLKLIATSPQNKVGAGAPVYEGTFGRGIEYRLVREHSFKVPGDSEVWEGLVDARTGQVISFRGTAVHNVAKGKVRPNGSLTTETSMDFPLVDYRRSPVLFADEDGQFTSSVANRSFMQGKEIEMDDVCGPIDFSTPVGDLDFGGAANPFSNDCNSTAGPTDGNTSASRTSYFWANDILKRIKDFIPGFTWQAGSATGPLTIEVNRDEGVCLGQYFEAPDHKIEMSRDVPRCNNAGENVTHILHEVGHAIDFTDGSHPGTDGGSGEGYADIVAFLHTEDACNGRGAAFADGCGAFMNYTCSAGCDGFREADWQLHQPPVPHTPETNLACQNWGGGWIGPCGKLPHCEMPPAVESVWDLIQEFILAGDPQSVAFDRLEDLFYSTRPTAGSMFTCSFAQTTREGGAIAGSLYHSFRAYDDCDGDPSNGTPNAEAIFTALSRHEIAVGTASDPANQDNDCSASVTVTEPASGDHWTIGNGRFIRWTTDGVAGNVRIALSRNGGAFQTLFANTPNDGVQSWLVTGPVADTAVVRVSSVADPGVFDDSEAFSITVAGFVIDSTGDAGDANLKDNACATAGSVCTLRAAIEQANASIGQQRLTFALPGGNTFQPASPLPTVTDPIHIDGNTQTPQGVVEIDGSSAGASVDGLLVTAGGSEIGGLVINRFDGNGIHLSGGSGNIIERNRIGTDQSGLLDRGNTLAGVQVSNSADNIIGALRPGGGNVLSGNRFGLRLTGSGSSGNLIFGNTIGLSVYNQGPLGNDRHGIVIVNGASRNVINDGVPRGVIIRDMTANFIAHNGRDGISVLGGTRNDIYANRIFDNGGLGIDLSNDGVTPNDAGDGDSGPNNLQNFPVILNVDVQATKTVITGTLDLGFGFDQSFLIDVYANTACDPSGHGEGERHYKPFTLTTQPNGDWTVEVLTLFQPGEAVTATATRLESTSEFSACFTVPTPPTQPGPADS
ncbi:MAG: hypothetical protein AAF481_16100 [Acidobacteriota bacterium]